MYSIIEIANTHGGDIEYLHSLIEEFEGITEDIGIKFQPFKYDRIALSDFEWYPVYEELFFTHKEWSEIITKAKKTKDVWLDLFDTYSIEILEKNLSKIYGIKLQTSVLNNHAILKPLKSIDLSDKKLIINIAGREFDDVENIINFFESNFNVEELLIEVGFQSYPTKLVDSGISKIKKLKDKFQKRIVFVDHVDGKHINSKILPVVAALHGADVIEKHVMHSERETKYDHFSSVYVKEYSEIISLLREYETLTKQPFINQDEIEYLNNSIQLPVLEKDKLAGEILSINDFNYKRTASKGLSYNELKTLFSQGNIKLNKDLQANSLIQSKDLEKVNTACIIAARLKSSRLKEKAKLKIGAISSVELCIKNCLRFKNIDNTILATSNNQQDAELKNFTYSPSVIFHTGDAEDVIQRYLDVIREKKIDTFIRVTGDMPYVSNDIAEYLLENHFLSGADYTVAKDAAVGTNLEIINSVALEKVKTHFPNAQYSEYMTWYFQNNPEHFNLNFVNLPKKWIRDYRLTLDYQEDLDMFNLIETHFENTGKDFSIDELFNFLDSNPKVADLNSNMSLTYKTDDELIQRLNKHTKIN